MSHLVVPAQRGNVRIGDILQLKRRWLRPEPDTAYVQIGVRSFGKGIFHKPPLKGIDLGGKRVLRIEPGDLVLNNVFAWEGAVAVAGSSEEGTIGSHRFVTLRPSGADACDVHFLQLYLASHDGLDILRRASPGSAGRNRTLGIDRLLDQPISIPKIDEQRRIVARLQQLLARIGEAQTLIRESGIALRHLPAARAASVFQRVKVRSPLKTLRDLVTVRGGGTPSKANPAFWQGELPWVSPKDMKTREIADAADHISELATIASPAKTIEPGAVLVVIRGMILMHTVPAAILRVRAAINQDMKALIPSAEVLPEYLRDYMWSSNNDLLKLVEKSTHDTRRLDTKKLLAIAVPVPVPAEQRRIVEEIGRIREAGEEALRLRQCSLSALDALRLAILDRAFKGEL